MTTETSIQRTVALVVALTVGLWTPVVVADEPTLARRLQNIVDENLPTSAERYSRDVTTLVCPLIDLRSLRTSLVPQGWSVDSLTDPDTGDTDYTLYPPFNLRDLIGMQQRYLTVTMGAGAGCKARMRMSFL